MATLNGRIEVGFRSLIRLIRQKKKHLQLPTSQRRPICNYDEKSVHLGNGEIMSPPCCRNVSLVSRLIMEIPQEHVSTGTTPTTRPA
jgi:hypothetical protein